MKKDVKLVKGALILMRQDLGSGRQRQTYWGVRCGSEIGIQLVEGGGAAGTTGGKATKSLRRRRTRLA